MNKQETISKLQQEMELQLKFISLGNYIEEGAYNEASEKLNEARQALGELPDEPDVYYKFPVFNDVNYENLNKLLESKEQDSKVFKIALAVTAVLVLIFFISNSGLFNTLSVIGIMASIFLGIRSSTSKKKYTDEKQKSDKLQSENEESLAAFKAALEIYPQQKQKFVSSAKGYGAKYREYHAQVKQIMADFDKNFNNASDEMTATFEKIKEESIVPEEYAHFVPKLITLLKSGRADTLKEALNLAIEEERAERQAEAFLEEEARRTALMEEQAREARRHNEQMEREAQMQNKIMQDQADYAARQAKQQAAAAEREAFRKEAEARNKARDRCSKCANYPTCHSYIPNCGAFRAKY